MNVKRVGSDVIFYYRNDKERVRRVISIDVLTQLIKGDVTKELQNCWDGKIRKTSW